ncbi:zinc-ribbon domain-containing protein [Priestia sp. TGN 0903]|uniref:zinc-ribbon domain-containing protein n=1 Tax=Priestia sp. TGN 0903 TaxID=3420730 RepID=UPI003D78A7F5
MEKTNIFSDLYPNLVKEWHPSKNGELKPSDFSFGSKKKVWWVCKKGHEWETSIGERSRGTRCPYCTGHKVSKENSLMKKNPEISDQWHPSKNNSLTPEQVSVKSSKKVWWICKEGHEWCTAVSERTRGYGCPFCSGRYPSETNNLQVIFPDVAKEWHYEKNNPLKPENITSKSDKKVWWKCSKGHEWQNTVKRRTNGGKCPYCLRRKASDEYNLEKTHPELAKEWHYKNNNYLKPSEVIPSSSKHVWWKAECGHEWETAINIRTRGHGCPYCAGKRVLYKDSLLNMYPLIAEEWHSEKNSVKKPENYLPGSMEKVWWKCSKGHEWQASINNRVYKKSNCPKCFGATSFNEQAVFFYIKKLFKDAENRYLVDKRTEIDIYIPTLKLGIEYDGLFFHSKEENAKRDENKNKILYEKGIKLIRIRNLKAPVIQSYNSSIVSIEDDRELVNVEAAIKKLVSMISPNEPLSIDIERDYGNIMKQAMRFPVEKTVAALGALAEEWDLDKNKDLKPYMLLQGSKKKVWWKCNKGHEWEAVVNDRVSKKSRCPYCMNKKVSAENSLETLFPSIAREWHPQKNNLLTPKDVVAGSLKRVWWKCQKGHEWANTVSHRTRRNQNCPYCSGKRVNLENSVYTTHPHLVEEWNYEKNTNINPKEVKYGSTKKVWWKCYKGHEWEATINSRTNQNSGCPYCSNKKVCSDNCLATTDPQLSRQWNFSRNRELKPTIVIAGSAKKVWWKCEKNHEWEATILSRTRGSGCPHCYKLKRNSKQN